jgi:two-component system nitrate/nitrite response regulator NarL
MESGATQRNHALARSETLCPWRESASGMPIPARQREGGMSCCEHSSGAFGQPEITPEIPKVVIVSDVRLYREGLQASLARDRRLEVIASVHAEDALAAFSIHAADAVLLDAAMESGLSLARTIRSLHPALRLVGFGMNGDAANLVACAESGLAAFVDCHGTIDELVGAVHGALRGELTCSPQVTAMMCDRLASLASTGSEGCEPLTRRERQVAALVADGLSNKEIAIDLRIGPATVKNHVHNILDKLKVRRRAAIARQLKGLLAR